MYTIKKHNKYSYVTIVSIPLDEIEKIDFALCNQPTETPDAYYKRQEKKPTFITNGGLFVMKTGNTCFGLRDEGHTINFSEYQGLGITGDKELSFGKNLSENSTLRDFISGYPCLISSGNKLAINYAKEIDYNARRTAIGWNDTTYFIMIVELPGLRFSAMADIFMELGAKYAINLDGGGSTRLLVDGVRKSTATSTVRPVDNVMCIYMKKEDSTSTVSQTPILYRVQVGAFSLAANAAIYLAKVRDAGFEDAYVRKVGNYYKVQIGAYSVKLNAERVKDRLVAAGFDTMITTK